MEHARHVFRAALVVLVVAVGVSIGRGFLVPPTYGLYGPYRAANVKEQREVRAPRHGGAAACTGCHAEKAATRAQGSHKGVSCEICHGPLSLHVAGGKRTAAMPVDASFKLCSRCHRAVLGRPAAFPQVALDQHLSDGGAGPLEGRVCLDCHDPHSPKP